jgi:Na+/proline symporter
MAKINKWIYWTPRILSILFIIFLAIFSLDVFDENLGFWGTIFGLLMHNIPSLILLVILLISWKHEKVGAVSFFIAGLLYTLLTLMRAALSKPFAWYMALWVLMIAVPVFIIAFLWRLNWKKKNEHSRHNNRLE